MRTVRHSVQCTVATISHNANRLAVRDRSKDLSRFTRGTLSPIPKGVGFWYTRPGMSRARTERIQRKLLTWYNRQGRDLPWRKTRDPYKILVSEIMLQQTQVSRVIPKYQAWLKVFPTVQALARAPLPKVLQLWSGLGYNSRAVRLRQAAEAITTQYHGRVPMDFEGLMALPGIGRYTAGAVLSFAGRRRIGVVDTNVRKVVGRVMYGVKKIPNEKKFHKTVEDLVPAKNPDLWNHALMDLGATICFNRRPDCEHCPLQSECSAYPAILKQPQNRNLSPQGKFLDSDRYWRGKIINLLIQNPQLRLPALTKKLSQFGTISSNRQIRLLRALEDSGLIQQTKSGVTLAP